MPATCAEHSAFRPFGIPGVRHYGLTFVRHSGRSAFRPLPGHITQSTYAAVRPYNHCHRENRKECTNVMHHRQYYTIFIVHFIKSNMLTSQIAVIKKLTLSYKPLITYYLLAYYQFTIYLPPKACTYCLQLHRPVSRRGDPIGWRTN